MNKNKKYCQNCGAKVTTEICPYCKVKSGINQNEVELEYPVLDYETIPKSPVLAIFIVVLLLIFGFTIPFILPLFFNFGTDVFSIIVDIVFISTIGLLFIYFFIKLFKYVYKYKTTQKNGEIIIGNVHGYIDENNPDDKFQFVTVKLLVDTKDGKRYILFKLDDRNRPYKIGTNVKLKVYKNYCVFAEDEKYYFE